MLKRTVFFVGMLLAVTFLPGTMIGAQTPKPITYNEPLAYVGWDGNIWITDLKSGAGTRITKDGIPLSTTQYRYYNVPNDAKVTYYSGLAWSPNGEMLAAGRAVGFVNGAEHSLHIFPSGKPSLELKGNGPAMWSPNGMALVYSSCPNLYAGVPVREVSIATQETQTIAVVDCSSAISGHMQGWWDYGILLARETGEENQGNVEPHFLFTGTPYGYLYTRTGYISLNRAQKSVPGETVMIGPDGKMLWKAPIVWGLSSDRRFMYTKIHEQPSDEYLPVIIDLATGVQSRISVNAPNGEVFTISRDRKTLFYSTVDWNEVRRDYSMVALWQLSLETGKVEKLFTRRGRGIGVITTTPDDNGVVVSFVTSTAIGAAKGHPSFAEGRAHLELLHVDLASRKVKLLALGGQPAFGSKPFTAIPA